MLAGIVGKNAEGTEDELAAGAISAAVDHLDGAVQNWPDTLVLGECELTAIRQNDPGWPSLYAIEEGERSHSIALLRNERRGILRRGRPAEYGQWEGDRQS